MVWPRVKAQWNVCDILEGRMLLLGKNARKKTDSDGTVDNLIGSRDVKKAAEDRSV